jgi:GcrA cell cycle regulator|tara:strand:- start:984 stop:1481 length:498 start_codon:yes stop_codon:yes gene_type:complete
MSWTPERENKLKDLWNKGHTASQIATLLGDTTRNAVIGKAHRLNLEARAASRKNTTAVKTKDENIVETKGAKPSRRSRFKSLLLDKNFEAENPKTLEELTDETCKWPIGHPPEKDFYFCGRKPLEKFPYCKLHILYAFQPKNSKEDNIPSEEEIPKFIEKKIKSA